MSYPYSTERNADRNAAGTDVPKQPQKAPDTLYINTRTGLVQGVTSDTDPASMERSSALLTGIRTGQEFCALVDPFHTPAKLAAAAAVTARKNGFRVEYI